MVLLPVLLVAVSSLSPQDVPDAFPRDGARPILDNARVTVYEVKLAEG